MHLRLDVLVFLDDLRKRLAQLFLHLLLGVVSLKKLLEFFHPSLALVDILQVDYEAHWGDLPKWHLVGVTKPLQVSN